MKSNHRQAGPGPARPRRGRWLGVLAIGLALALAAPAARAQTAGGDPWTKISQSALDRLGLDGKAVVVVQLADAGGRGKGPGAGPARQAVAAAQARVIKQMASEPGWRLRYRFQTIPYLVGEVSDLRALGTLAMQPGVVGIEPDHRVKTADAESSDRIGATETRTTYHLSGGGVNVGVIDTGIDLANADLSDSVVTSHSFLGGVEGSDVQDNLGHGTHVAGILTGDGMTSAPMGIAPGVGLVVVKAVDVGAGLVSDVARGVDWIVAQNATLASPVKFINLSLVFVCADDDPGCLGELPTGCPCDSITGYDLFKAAVAQARAEGVRLIAAAGNDGDTVLRVPACFSDVVSVGATFDMPYPYAPSLADAYPTTGTFNDLGGTLFADCNHTSPVLADQLACFTNRNPCMDFVAPGYLISSTQLGSTQPLASFGTSQATAHVTAALALLQEAVPSMSADDLLALLHASAVKVPEDLAIPAGTNYDRIDVLGAVQLARPTSAENWMLMK